MTDWAKPHEWVEHAIDLDVIEEAALAHENKSATIGIAGVGVDADTRVTVITTKD